ILGMLNSAAQPHGRGTMVYGPGHRFEGRFCNGDKEGKGCFYFEDGSMLEGHYVSNNLEGIGRYTFSDGSYIVGCFKSGELNGPAKHYDYAGLITFEGQYQDNIKFGLCWHFDEFGGSIVGLVDDDGEFTGDEIAYLYPDQETVLYGSFEEGRMVCAKAASFQGVRNNKLIIENLDTEEKYSFDESADDVITVNPLLSDPYEQKRVYVAKSLIPGAGEGLFSKIFAEKDQVMSFYNGIRITHQEVDDRSWIFNDNTISLDETTVIDVPVNSANVNNYCASLGHKANHSFTPNCKYDLYYHPRFGNIKCIRSISDVAPNEELTVDYGYTTNNGLLEAPDWYKAILKHA
ncbi:uncharacterized protein TRIADDRAFT_26073, partial [Trichoplax adhaerens]